MNACIVTITHAVFCRIFCKSLSYMKHVAKDISCICVPWCNALPENIVIEYLTRGYV